MIYDVDLSGNTVMSLQSKNAIQLYYINEFL